MSMLSSRRLIGLSGPIIAAIVSRGGQTILAVYLARMLGVAGYGTFIFATGAAILGGMVADFGWPTVVNRELPQRLRDKDWSGLRGLIKASDGFVLLAGLLVAGVLVACAWAMPHLASGFYGAALLSVPFAFIFMRQQELAAVDRASLGMLLDQGMAATIVLVANLIYPMSVEGSIVMYAIASTLLVVGGTAVFRARLPAETWTAAPRYTLRHWLGSSSSMFSAVLPRMLVTRFDVLMVAPFAGIAEAGLFGAAFRVTLLMTFPQFVLQTIVMPRFSRAFANSDHAAVRKLLIGSMAFALVTTLPIILPLLIVPAWIMHLFFGSEFTAGGPALFWLGIGQFALAASIPLNAMIVMGGDQKALGRQGLAILVVTFVLGCLVIPAYGALGAALVTTAANVALTIGMCALALPVLKWPTGSPVTGVADGEPERADGPA